MNLKNKLEAERQDEPLILLYMEGLFWKAYEQSAMRFAKEVKAYKLQKRFIKTVNGEVVSMGFPNSSLQEVLKGWEFVRMNDKQLSFHTKTAFTAAEFEEWKSALPLESEAVSEALGTVSTGKTGNCFSETERQVLSQLLAFRVEAASPLQCMMLVSDLQALLKQ